MVHTLETKKKTGPAVRRTAKDYDWSKPFPFTFEEAKAAIPKECFERSYATSLGYLARDLIMYGLCLYVGFKFLLGHPILDSGLLAIPVWLIFAAVTGTVGTGLWVIAHECGHHAFTPNRLLNDCIGFVLHHYFTVPYHGWQWSHAVHHRRTNNFEEGESHVPNTLEKVLADPSFPFRAWIWRNTPRWFSYGFAVSLFLLLGWPLYVMFHVTGAAARAEKGANHFDWRDANPLYPSNWRLKVKMGSITILATFAFLFYLSCIGYAGAVLKLWVGPVLVTHAWLIAITFVQHTNEEFPHMHNDSWDYLRGALCTVDARWGSIFDFLHHDISNTHLVHHIFSEMPHYNQRVATKALLSFLAKYDLDYIHVVNRSPWKTVVEGQYQYFFVKDIGGGVMEYGTMDDAIDIYKQRETAKQK